MKTLKIHPVKPGKRENESILQAPLPIKYSEQYHVLNKGDTNEIKN
jgi:hypothetical protein